MAGHTVSPAGDRTRVARRIPAAGRSSVPYRESRVARRRRAPDRHRRAPDRHNRVADHHNRVARCTPVADSRPAHTLETPAAGHPDNQAAACSQGAAAVVVGHGVHPVDGSGSSQSWPRRPWGARLARSVWSMLRPESWTGLAGGSPVPVGTGAPGSRPRFVVETRRAERGVKSLFGGSKCAGRSVKRTLQPRHMYNGRAEPLMSRRRPCPANPGPGLVRRVSSGYGRRHVHTVWFETGETRLPGLRRAKTKGISRW